MNAKIIIYENINFREWEQEINSKRERERGKKDTERYLRIKRDRFKQSKLQETLFLKI